MHFHTNFKCSSHIPVCVCVFPEGSRRPWLMLLGSECCLGVLYIFHVCLNPAEINDSDDDGPHDALLLERNGQLSGRMH